MPPRPFALSVRAHTMPHGASCACEMKTLRPFSTQRSPRCSARRWIAPAGSEPPEGSVMAKNVFRPSRMVGTAYFSICALAARPDRRRRIAAERRRSPGCRDPCGAATSPRAPRTSRTCRGRRRRTARARPAPRGRRPWSWPRCARQSSSGSSRRVGVDAAARAGSTSSRTTRRICSRSDEQLVRRSRKPGKFRLDPHGAIGRRPPLREPRSRRRARCPCTRASDGP